MPDPDSDDEMEVDEDFSERGNMFDETEKAQDEPAKSPAFVFPVVSSRPVGYEVSYEFKEAAGMLFERGMQEFLSVA